MNNLLNQGVDFISKRYDRRTWFSRRGFLKSAALAPILFNPVKRAKFPKSNQMVSSFWNSPQSPGILLTDLSLAEPQAAISLEMTKGRWYQIPYETKDNIKGIMVARGQLSHPPDLKLKLPARGWYAIYVGLFGGSKVDEFWLRLKLSDEKLFDSLAPSRLGYQRKADGSWLRPRAAISTTDIEEIFWKAADLNGQDLVISHLKTSFPSVVQLAFIRLVSLKKEEVKEYRSASGSPETKLLAVEMDGQARAYLGFETVEDLQEEIEPLRNTDVGKLFLGTGGIGAGQTLFPSRVGEMMGSDQKDFPVVEGKRAAESLLSYQSRGIDPLKVAVDYAHSMDIDVYLGFRMGTMSTVPPTWVEPVAFWKDHPEWRCQDRDGNTIVRLSMAYKEVRRFYVNLLSELAGYGVKGVQLIYTRRPPFVLFEPPVIEDFKNKHGIDPRDLPKGIKKRKSDPPVAHERLERHWATYVTTFMRELRQALDQLRPKGPRIEVLANVGNDFLWNRHAALDLETWTREGLVDILNPYTGGDGSHLVDYDYFKRITCGTSCIFFEDITPRNMFGSQYAYHAQRAYAGGASGLAFWDSEGRIKRKTQWHTLRRLGHRKDLDSMLLQPKKYTLHPLKLINGWSVELQYR